VAYADERCRGLVRACIAHNRLLPEVGYELQDTSGRVCADAELAWPARKLALLLPERLDASQAFRDQGWSVYTATDLTVEQLLDLLRE
jgi:DEAD/DEAH box helicase domain-containing protein